ncbi:MAG: hypothetical protein H7Z21_06415 [Hymenobacter sp.]|nr:hypothetical protein [Hymenobacter sp.]
MFKTIAAKPAQFPHTPVSGSASAGPGPTGYSLAARSVAYINSGRHAAGSARLQQPAGLSIQQRRAKYARLHAQHPLSLVLVDYIQLMRGDTKGNREEEVGSISRGLKELANPSCGVEEGPQKSLFGVNRLGLKYLTPSSPSLPCANRPLQCTASSMMYSVLPARLVPRHRLRAGA